MKTFWMMCGIPGSGKSTWIKNKIENFGGVWISRDAIRFSLLQENEDYFSHEDEVFVNFISSIQEQINNPLINDIYVDATHLNKKSRDKVLNRLNLNNVSEFICVVMNTPIETSLYRNSLRSGLERVPDSSIRRMASSLQIPDSSEIFNKIFFVNEDGNEKIENIRKE